MSNIQIHLDEDNEFRFGVAVEGAGGGNVKCRMVLESPDSKMGIIFPGTATPNGEIKVMIPSLDAFLNEGIYPMKLEVLVDDRIFTPINMNVELKQSTVVTAEAKGAEYIRKGPTVSASISSIISENADTAAVTRVEAKTEPVRRVNESVDIQRRIRESRRKKASAPAPVKTVSQPKQKPKTSRKTPTKPRSKDKELHNMLLNLFRRDDI